MKSTDVKNNQTASNSSKPFFGKGNSDSFFSDSKLQTNSFFNSVSVQPSMTVGEPDDPYEKEAEKVSGQVVDGFDQANSIQRKFFNSGLQPFAIQPFTINNRISRKWQKTLSRTPLIAQAKCSHCEEEEKMQQKSGDIQFTGEGSTVSPDIESKIQSMKGSGESMDAVTRAGMESSFGADFSGVKVHNNSQAVQMSQQLNAHAFTVGNDIFFNEGRYQPQSKQGAGLLAHELTHTIQQGASLQNKRINNSSLLSSFSAHSSAHLSAINSNESAGLSKKEIAQLEKLPEEEMKKMQQLQMLQKKKEVDEVQKKSKVGIMRSCGGGGGGTPPAPTPATPAAPAATASIPDINAPNTPAPVKRIIPRKDLAVNITVAGATAANPVVLSIDGAGGGNGTATINGAATHNVIASGIVNLKGGTQTDPGKANNLKLVAKQGTSTLAQSNPFSVAAYPVAIGFNYNRLVIKEVLAFLHPTLLWWGAAYDVAFTSDSGTPGDCDKTKISENVLVNTGTGYFAGVTPITSNFFQTTLIQTDHHVMGEASVASMKAAIDAADITSKYIFHQFFRFGCERTNIAEDKVAGPKVPTSGFKITGTISKYFKHVKKEGFANNAVAAGSVSDSAVKNAKIS